MTALYHNRMHLKKLIAKIPGFKGYFAMVDRRQADKVLREVVADRFQTQWVRLSAIQKIKSKPERSN
jgi:hypothetical protein